MFIKKREFKLELILFLCLCVLLFRMFPELKKESEPQSVGLQKDEQVTEALLVVEYTAGSEALIKKEAAFFIPSPTVAPLPEQTLCVADVVGTKYVLEDLLELEFLKDNLYIVNSSTKMTKEEFDVNYFIEKDLTLERSDEPQILIFHTHGSEAFADSRPGESSDTVTGAGELLAELLRENYGYHVIHDTTIFDQKNGKDNRNYAYSEALDHIEKVLEQNPSIEVIIDLHRDAGTKRVTTIDGKQTAKVMLFNGLCRNTKGKLTYLPNENLKDNLAFSFQMKLIGDALYPGLMNRIFLKDYRYNMHLKERYLLIELGTEKNTVEEAMNAMEPLAEVLHQVLGG